MKAVRRAVCVVLSSGLLWAGPATDSVQSEPSSAADTYRLSLAWHRWQEGGGRTVGELTLTPEAIEIDGRKQRVRIELDAIRSVALGTMKSDVDTDWILMAVAQEDGSERVAGLRDGRKMGFSSRTPELYERLKRLLRETGSGPYATPDGWRAFDALDDTFFMWVPQGWSIAHREVVSHGEGGLWGNMFVSPEALSTDDERYVELPEAIVPLIARGELPGFFVERRMAEAGMRCDGIADKALSKVAAWAHEPLLFGEQADALDFEAATRVEIGGCRGLRVVGRDPADGLDLELRVAAQGEMVALFGMRSIETTPAEIAERFDGAVRSFRFALGR